MAFYPESTLHRVNYTVRHAEHPAPEVAPPRCLLMRATLWGGRDPFYVRCIDCFNFREGGKDYYSHYGQEFKNRLRNIPSCCAVFIASDFCDILRGANECHSCPDNIRPIFHLVDIDIEPTSDALLEPALRASFEEAGPTTRPATIASMSRLVRPEEALCDNCNQCAICMEKMETRSALEMPCRHAFHEACLVKWLDIDHVCPLCRYKMPSED